MPLDAPVTQMIMDRSLPRRLAPRRLQPLAMARALR
jgi:hypothetical protein